MLNNLIKSTLVFAAGAVAGAAVALLLAPQTGKEARKQLKELANEVKERAQNFCEQVKEKVECATQEQEA